MTNRTLTIVLCQTRESFFTFSSLNQKVLKPLKSDLAFCGSTPDINDQILKYSRYIWDHVEPNDWASAFDQITTVGSDWRELADFGNLFLGGSGYRGSKGSGLIVMYWRQILKMSLTEEVLSKYDWFVITRSDFQWVTSHPNIEQLNPEKIYFLNGEKYGGVSDRHIIFNKKFQKQIFSIASPIFENTEALRYFLAQNKVEDLNPEKFIDTMLNWCNLRNHIFFLPYLGYTIRHQQTRTRWSSGTYNKKFGFYIKYPNEFRDSYRSRFYLKNTQDWDKYFKNKWTIRKYFIKSIEFFSERQLPFKYVTSRCINLLDKVLQNTSSID
jgi:hypothetical protein